MHYVFRIYFFLQCMWSMSACDTWYMWALDARDDSLEKIRTFYFSKLIIRLAMITKLMVSTSYSQIILGIICQSLISAHAISTTYIGLCKTWLIVAAMIIQKSKKKAS